MFPFKFQHSLVHLTLWGLLIVIGDLAVADQPAVTFDVPALVGVHVLPTNESHSGTATQKTIEVVIPVTTEIRPADRDNIQEFRFDVFWNRNVFPICDYGPKTQTTSPIEGLISVDKTNDKSAVLGLNLNGGYQEMVKGSGKAELSNRNGMNLHYQEIPQHEVLVASGTIHRGTGAFFRFHPSRINSLEGGRDLVVAFEVPQHWRGGLLQVECRALGSRKRLGAWSEPFEFNRAFVLPIYLDGDDQARRAATEFVRSEQQLRRKWLSHGQKPQRDLFQQFQVALVPGNSKQASLTKVPTDWVHYLIQSSDTYLDKYRRYLPSDVEMAAEQFVVARADLLQLSR